MGVGRKAGQRTPAGPPPYLSPSTPQATPFFLPPSPPPLHAWPFSPPANLAGHDPDANWVTPSPGPPAPDHSNVRVDPGHRLVMGAGGAAPLGGGAQATFRLDGPPGPDVQAKPLPDVAVDPHPEPCRWNVGVGGGGRRRWAPGWGRRRVGAAARPCAVRRPVRRPGARSAGPGALVQQGGCGCAREGRRLRGLGCRCRCSAEKCTAPRLRGKACHRLPPPILHTAHLPSTLTHRAAVLHPRAPGSKAPPPIRLCTPLWPAGRLGKPGSHGR